MEPNFSLNFETGEASAFGIDYQWDMNGDLKDYKAIEEIADDLKVDIKDIRGKLVDIGVIDNEGTVSKDDHESVLLTMPDGSIERAPATLLIVMPVYKEKEVRGLSPQEIMNKKPYIYGNIKFITELMSR